MFISQYIKMMSAVIVLLSAMSLWGQNDTLGTRDNPQKIEWKKLENVTVEEKDYLYVPTFGADILALKGKYIQLRGYILPLEQAKKQKNFVLSANPVSSCFFCMPGGPESMVDVRAADAVTFSYNPISITGKLELLEDDPMGMYFRLADAAMVEDSGG